jgi:hypothetical protein
VVTGADGDRIVGRKARIAGLPGVQELDPILVEQAFRGEKGDHLVAEQELGRVSVDIRYGVPGAGPVPAAARAESVNMGMPSQV